MGLKRFGMLVRLTKRVAESNEARFDLVAPQHMAVTDLPGVQHEGGAGNRCLAKIEWRAIAANATAHHDEPDLRRAQITGGRQVTELGKTRCQFLHRRFYQNGEGVAAIGVSRSVRCDGHDLSKGLDDYMSMSKAVLVQARIWHKRADAHVGARRDMTMTHEPLLTRGSGVTVWRQIAEVMEAEIAEGRLAPGSRLPTEAALAERFGVNRHTLRQAMKVLADKGLVRVAQGSGTFVEQRPLAYPIGTRTRFSEIVVAQAREPAGRLLSSERITLDEQLALSLALPIGSPALKIESAHFADGVPISWAVAAFPLPRFARVAEVYAVSGSISAALAACGVPDYLRATTRIGAGIANPMDVARLEIAAGRPVLEIESVNVDPAGVPVQWTRSRFAGDRVKLTVAG